MQNTLVFILGPTGVGKTDLSAELALYFGCEIISCDSRQFYREMITGTSRPSEEQLKSVKHHFIGFLSVNDYYSASIYERDVMNLLPELFNKMNPVIITGGSGMYADAVFKGIDDIPDVDPAAREKYNRMYAEEGTESLRVALRILDPDYFNRVDLRNARRIIRALEICETTGRPYSSFLTGGHQKRDFRSVRIGLNRPRDELYGMIDSRVDRMLASGLEEEARSLYPIRHLNALNTVGYREFFGFFEGAFSREKTVELIKRNSRRYAKRQLTWWTRQEDIMWFHPSEKGQILEYIGSMLLGEGNR